MTNTSSQIYFLLRLYTFKSILSTNPNNPRKKLRIHDFTSHKQKGILNPSCSYSKIKKHSQIKSILKSELIFIGTIFCFRFKKPETLQIYFLMLSFFPLIFFIPPHFPHNYDPQLSFILKIERNGIWKTYNALSISLLLHIKTKENRRIKYVNTT